MKIILTVMFLLSSMVMANVEETFRRCPNLTLPNSVDEDFLSKLLNFVPKTELGTLFDVTHKSDTKPIPVSGDPVIYLSGYGVELSFQTSVCGGYTTYVFVKSNDTWKLIDQIETTAGIACAEPKKAICD